MTDLTNKIALVTGGAQGLGAQIVDVLRQAGATVIVADLNSGSNGMALDVSDAAACADAIETIEREHGRLDILINNAGTDKTVSIEELDQVDFDRVIAVNLRGPFALAKAAFPVMRASGGGYIVNIVSTAAKRAWANASAYHASKWGLLGLSHALHVEGRPLGIKVTALLAGGMRTPFILDRFPDTPLENLQDPRAVAETILFLLGQPKDTVIPELMVVPMRETSWP